VRTGPPAAERDLRAGDNSYGIGRSLSTECRSTGAASDYCWIVVLGARAPLDYNGRDRMARMEDKHE
jgi:hypothetical protein